MQNKFYECQHVKIILVEGAETIMETIKEYIGKTGYIEKIGPESKVYDVGEVIKIEGMCCIIRLDGSDDRIEVPGIALEPC